MACSPERNDRSQHGVAGISVPSAICGIHFSGALRDKFSWAMKGVKVLWWISANLLVSANTKIP
jgi:hypothetical protein